jgi:hypothetical protein
VEISVDLYMRTGKKNYPYFYVPNHRKVTIITYKSVRRYSTSKEQTSIGHVLWSLVQDNSIIINRIKGEKKETII